MTSTSLFQQPLAQALDSPYIVALAILSYLLLVRFMRYRRADKIRAGWGDGPGKRPLSSMTGEDAFKILLELQELEFPAAFHKARAVALLKVRAVSISHNISPIQAAPRLYFSALQSTRSYSKR